MRLHVLILAAGLFGTVFSTSLRNLGNLSHGPGHSGRRDLPGLFGDWDPDGQDTGTGEDGTPEQVSADIRPSLAASRTDGSAFNMFSAFDTIEQTSSKARTSASLTIATSAGTGSITAQPTPSATASNQASLATSVTSLGTSSGTSSISSSGSTWKIVGVAVISFSAVALILIAAVFFDHWWRFVRDILWKKGTLESTEEMVPDWEKASWEVRFGDDRHRYPSFSSVPSATPAQTQVHRQGSTKLKDWTQARRLSGLSSTGLALTPAERLLLSPGYPANPEGVYLAPDPRPNSGNVDPFVDKPRTPTIATAPGSTKQHADTSLGIPQRRPSTRSMNPFTDKATPYSDASLARTYPHPCVTCFSFCCPLEHDFYGGGASFAAPSAT